MAAWLQDSFGATWALAGVATISKIAFARAGGARYFWGLAPGLGLLAGSFRVAWWFARS